MLDDHLRFADERSNAKIDAQGMSRRDARIDALVQLILAVRSAIADWTKGGKYGHLVDAPVDEMSWRMINTFELRSLPDLPRAYSGVLALIQHRMEAQMDGRPTRLLFGEAWEYFSNPEHLEALRTSMPNWRRDNASANFSTQAIEQLTGNPLTSLLMSSCQTRLFLPNPQALSGFVRPGYEAMELQDEEIRHNIVMATPKCEAYMVRPDGRRLIDVHLGSMARLVCGSNSKEAHALLDDLLAQHGAEAFPYEFLRVHGFHEQAQRLLPALVAADD
jgi:type IV secretory pathway VirB4 component